MYSAILPTVPIRGRCPSDPPVSIEMPDSIKMGQAIQNKHFKENLKIVFF